jgi:hypothetical protein
MSLKSINKMVCRCVWGDWGEVSLCTRTFQGLYSVRLWTPTILHFNVGCSKMLKNIVDSIDLLKKREWKVQYFGPFLPLLCNKIDLSWHVQSSSHLLHNYLFCASLCTNFCCHIALVASSKGMKSHVYNKFSMAQGWAEGVVVIRLFIYNIFSWIDDDGSCLRDLVRVISKQILLRR